MLITDLRDYVQLQGRVSLQNIARHFHIKESAIEQMMTVWIKKNKISVITPNQITCSTGNCSDCIECDDSAQQIYIWRED